SRRVSREYRSWSCHGALQHLSRTVNLQLAAQRARGNPQQLRRRAVMSIRFRHGLEYHFPFNPLEAEDWRATGWRRELLDGQHQVRGANRGPFGEDGRLAYQSSQLADIARPAITDQGLDPVRRKAQSAVMPRQEQNRQGGHVFRPLPKRRNQQA